MRRLRERVGRLKGVEMEFFGALLGLSILGQVLVAIAAGLLFPAFWIWMVIDAITRPTETFPSRDDAEKIVWVIVMLAIQPVSVLYFFLVWRPARRAAQLAPVVCAAQGPDASPAV